MPAVIEVEGLRKSFRIPSVARRTIREHVFGALHPRTFEELRVLDGVSLPLRPNIGIHTQPISFIGLPVVAVPVQTWGPWNAPLENNCGDMAGFAYPFAKTRFQRMMTGDPRPSLEERYHSRAEFIQKITDVAQKLVRDGYLLPPDADVVVANARTASGSIPERTEKK